MKKVFIFIFFVMLVNGLFAQTSSNDFYINQQQTAYLDNYSTWQNFVNGINVRVENQRQTMLAVGINARVVWVQEPTRMENELVNRAYRELPNSTRIGSAYQIQFMPYYGSMIYNVYIYSDPDGKKYYRLLRIQW